MRDYEVFPTVRGVSVYISDSGFLVIEQEKEDHQEYDQVIMIPHHLITMFAKAIREAVKNG